VGIFDGIFTNAGDVLNTAARLCDAAKAREILCSATFRDNISRRASSLINMYPGPPVFLKVQAPQHLLVASLLTHSEDGKFGLLCRLGPLRSDKNLPTEPGQRGTGNLCP